MRRYTRPQCVRLKGGGLASLGCSHCAVLCCPEWRVGEHDGVTAKTFERLGLMMMSCCGSGFEPVILHPTGSIAMAPDGCVTLAGSD